MAVRLADQQSTMTEVEPGSRLVVEPARWQVPPLSLLSLASGTFGRGFHAAEAG